MRPGGCVHYELEDDPGVERRLWRNGLENGLDAVIVYEWKGELEELITPRSVEEASNSWG